MCGACIWKIVKSGLCRSSCRDGVGAGHKRVRKRADYAELFFLYVLPEVRLYDLFLRATLVCIAAPGVGKQDEHHAV